MKFKSGWSLFIFFQGVLHMDFLNSYKIIAWLCWVPNLIIGDWIARHQDHRARAMDA